MNQDELNKMYESLPQKPLYPTRSPIVTKRVCDLTSEEISTIPLIRANYEKEVAAYRLECEKTIQIWNEFLKKIRLELSEEFGLTNHPKEGLLWEKVFSGEFREIYHNYSDYAELM